jgi:8-oxo-dGTP pyrophosphatase MutT (NUDIX family)
MTDKAAIIPFIKIDDKIHMLFMKPSDPTYGGPRFQMAKGNVDPGETPSQTALREGIEELGLRQSNIISMELLTTQQLTGLDDTYIISVFAAEVKSMQGFLSPHFETGETRWMTEAEFKSSGRASHIDFVDMLVNNF